MDERTDQHVEVTVEYETVVDDLAHAWAFIMDRIERVGPDPSVHIHAIKQGMPPMMQIFVQGEVLPAERKFHVSVQGTRKEEAEAEGKP